MQVAEQVFLAELSSLDHVFDGLAVPPDDRRLFAAGNGDDAKVEFGGQTAVEAHFLAAEVLALGQGGKVQKAKVDGLLDLVDIVAGSAAPRKYGFRSE